MCMASIESKQHLLSCQQSLERTIIFISEAKYTFTTQGIMTATAQIPGGVMVQQTAAFVLSQLARHRSSWNKETVCPPLIVGVQGPQGAGRYSASFVHIRPCRWSLWYLSPRQITPNWSIASLSGKTLWSASRYHVFGRLLPHPFRPGQTGTIRAW